MTWLYELSQKIIWQNPTLSHDKNPQQTGNRELLQFYKKIFTENQASYWMVRNWIPSSEMRNNYERLSFSLLLLNMIMDLLPRAIFKKMK